MISQIQQIPKSLVYEKGGGHAVSSNQFPKNDSQIKHLSRKKEGHIADTPENRELLLRVCNDENNYLGTDRYRKRWYAQILPDGRRVWVCTRDGIIQNCGINDTARPWDPDEGLSRRKSKGVVNNMEDTPQAKSFSQCFIFWSAFTLAIPIIILP